MKAKGLDNLKDQIQSQRQDFDLYPFDPSTEWSQVYDRIKTPETWSTWKIVAVAACVIFILAGGFFNSPRYLASNDVLVESIEFYEREIEYKTLQVSAILGDEAILPQLEYIDKEFEELQADLEQGANTEVVILAMMQNYQLKLHILEQMLVELKQNPVEIRL
ncbi:MAG: hypothetical protein AAF616_01980 [Bacteroidota bacterium]